MVAKAKELGMSACGITDHGTFAGAIDFLRTCRNEGIRPILGMEAYMCKSHGISNKKGQPAGRRGNKHLNLIAKNFKGFQNICTLSQTASLEGFYYDPRVDAELLYKHREGVIATSACLSNVVNWHLSNDQYEKAKQTVGCFKEIYGEDYYLEMMFHGIDREGKILPDIQRLARDCNVKTIITNDCHYLEREDAEFHEMIMCISSKKTIKDPRRIKFPYGEFYFKSKEEMMKVFGHCPESMNNTLEVAEKCDYSDIIFVQEGGSMKLPVFPLPEQLSSPYDHLHNMAWKGFEKLGFKDSPKHDERLKMELSDVKLIWDTKRYDFSTYFLIVEDIMRFAREKGIAAGVRGSGCGSLLLTCLGITDVAIEPLKFGLLWSRFLGFDSSHFISEDDFGINS